ncbi:MAG: hypothetical protein JWQ14_3022 [Adhaeribacter sp.]|nr:hypothetical protein [Adhaeribacter sp.]
MKKAAFYFFLFTLFSACQDDEIPRGLPACVKEKIDELKNKPTQNPPAKVWQYQYMGKTVYYIPPACCDQVSKLYDENCNFICAPDGGITGRGDGKCPEFFATRQNGILVWEDKR